MKTLPINSLRMQTKDKPLASLLAQFIIVILAGCMFCAIFFRMWASNHYLLRAFSEFSCIFIALAAFFVAWHTHGRIAPVNYLVGFGLLAVAVFDAFHAFFYLGFGCNPAIYAEPSSRFWVLGRLTEAAVLLLATYRVLHRPFNKWTGLAVTMAFSLGTSCAVLHWPGLMHELLSEGYGLTPASIAMEYAVIGLFAAGLYNIGRQINDRDVLIYRYIFLALLIAVPAEFCFILSRSPSSVYGFFGYVLKITHYYYLFRGVFVGAVNYSHAQVEAVGRYTTAILDGLPLGIVTCNHQRKLSYANQRALEILGCDFAEIKGLLDRQVVTKFRMKKITGQRFSDSAADSTKLQKRNIVALQKGRGYEVKLWFEIQDLEANGYMYLFDEVEKEQKLANLELQIQTIINNMRDFILVLDRNGYIIMCNLALAEAVEIQARDIVGLHIDQFSALVSFNGPKEGGGNWRPGCGEGDDCEASFVAGNGKRVEVLVRVAPIHNIDDKVIGTIVMGTDITGLKQKRQRMQQQEKLASLGQMAAGIVHEIKNPLTTIRGFGQLILAKAKDENIRRYAAIIDSEINAVNQFIADFLALAKPRPPVLKEVFLNGVVSSLKPMLENQLFMKGISLHLTLTTREKPVLADEVKLKQVIVNMVNNAVDALQETAAPRLTIITGLDEAAGRMCVTIRDNGKGIPGDQLAKLGTPFFTTKEGGTGLGLCICYQIVEEHMGKIYVDSAPGGGTSFTISLPVQGAVVAGRLDQKEGFA